MRGDPLLGLANSRKKCYTALYECPLHSRAGRHALVLRKGVQGWRSRTTKIEGENADEIYYF